MHCVITILVENLKTVEVCGRNVFGANYPEAVVNRASADICQHLVLRLTTETCNSQRDIQSLDCLRPKDV